MASTEVIALVILKNKEIYHSVINKEITTYFTKNAIKEIIETFSKIILEKSNIGAFSIDMESEQIQNIELRKYILHCRKFDNDNGITFITSKNYKHRIAYNLILQLKDILDKTQINSLFYESNDVQKIDIIEKINNNFWDLIIYGKVGPDEFCTFPFYDIVKTKYNKNKIAFIYGGDEIFNLKITDCHSYHINMFNRYIYYKPYSDYLNYYKQFGYCFVRVLER
jgi:hypothetical protein